MPRTSSIHLSFALSLSLIACTDAPADDRALDGSDDADGHVASDAGQAADATVDGATPPPPGVCDEAVNEATLCVGRISGHAGTRVAFPMYVVLPPGCVRTTQIHATLVPSSPVGTFVTRGLRTDGTCSAVSPMTNNAGFMFLSKSASSVCPMDLLPGLLSTVELDIASGTAPGDYEIALTGTGLGDNLATENNGCKGNGAISGRLTVLP